MDNIIYTHLGENTDTSKWWINFNNKHLHDCELEQLSQRYLDIFIDCGATPIISNQVLTGLKFSSSFKKLMFLIKYG